MTEGNGWDQYKKYVVNELERTNQRLSAIDKRLSHIERKLAVLDTKVYATVIIASVVMTSAMNLVLDLLKA